MDPWTRLKAWGNAAWPYVLNVALVATACTFLMDPISRDSSHYGRELLAGAAVVWLLVRTGLAYVPAAAKPIARAALLHGLVLLSTVGWFNYYQFDARVFNRVGDYTDTAYYYTNSKYLRQLSYFGLYAATIHADRQDHRGRTNHIKSYRDLRDYEVKPVKVALEHGAQLEKERFTPEEWRQFKHDIAYFMDRLDKRVLQKNFFVDHGYNPPPTWTVVGGALAEAVPVERLKWICHVDTVLIGLMFCGVGWAFGLETMLWAMLFYVVTFSGRWPILGTSLTRFDWLAALVLAVVFLKKERFGLAGAALAYSALNRIFPAIFFFGWGASLLIELVEERTISPKHRRFIAGVASMSIVLVGVGLFRYGPATFKASAHNLAMHNVSYSSHRVGLGDLLVYKGETTRAQINENGGIHKKELKVQEMQPLLRGAAVVALAFGLLFAWRSRRETWQLISLAVLPFYCATNPQINYWNLRVVPMIWHGANLDKPIHRLLMALLFLTEVATQYTKVQGMDRYTTTTTTSIGLALYFTVLVAWMALEIAAPEEAEEQPEAA